jgi:hypothetical protein
MLSKPVNRGTFESKNLLQLKTFNQTMIREKDGSRWAFDMCLDTKEES